MVSADKLGVLRAGMRKAGVQAYLIPGTDPHQSEYLPACWQRREWLSGFTGSAGELLVTARQAFLWTDGRYFLQAERELIGSGIELMRMGQPGVPSVQAKAAGMLRRGQRLGVDPMLVSIGRAAGLESALDATGASIAYLDENLVDQVWEARPALPRERVEALPIRFAGESIRSKLARVRTATREAGASGLVVTTLDAIAWLFNIRGRDVDFNPVALAYAVVTERQATLYVDGNKLSTQVQRHLGRGVTVKPYGQFAKGLSALRGRVLLDKSTASHWVQLGLEKAEVVAGVSPISTMKAKKNQTELAGMRSAHQRDGVAMVKFLRWLDEAVLAGGVTEMDAAEQLRAYRSEGEHFKGLSFRTISGYGPNGAIIHYSVSAKTNIPLKPKGLYLVDSGGQYLDGTTDITRTIAVGGNTTRNERDAYTRVLKGHIALAQARFPAGTTGSRLDTLARQFLWQAGLDYNHGTGHGVGAYLNVHEGPQSISPRGNAAALEPGNVQSNEPGYYEPGRFGIRIENLVEVVEVAGSRRSPRPVLGFGTLTLCPIDKRPLERRLLSDADVGWLNRYHQRVFKALSPALDGPDHRWLKAACAPI